MPDYTSHTDSALIELIQQNNQTAFDELYERYWKNIFREAVSVLKNQSDAEDCVQELFISIWKRRDKIQITGSVQAYLHKSIRYICIHFIEKNITKNNYLEELTAYLQNEQPVLTPDEIIGFEELTIEMQHIIEMLPEKMRNVFELSRNEQLSYREIALQLGISEETVKKQVYNALKFIRSQMKNTPMLVIIYILYCQNLPVYKAI
ncbi:MAG: RNA polymerase sigma-70 factor [Bacteroidetes bacterium]|nr:RNA polymerase sigma-70 factor [Bacteroidota bacterium]